MLSSSKAQSESLKGLYKSLFVWHFEGSPHQVFFSIYIFNSSNSSVLTAQCFSIPLFCVLCVSTNFQVSTVIKLSTHHKWECLRQGCPWSVLIVSEHQHSCSSAPLCYPKTKKTQKNLEKHVPWKRDTYTFSDRTEIFFACLVSWTKFNPSLYLDQKVEESLPSSSCQRHRNGALGHPFLTQIPLDTSDRN